MAIKWRFFDWMGKEVNSDEYSAITEKLLNELSFKELALHIGISYIANTLSKCEFKVYENGKPVRNELYYKLNVSPNPNQNSSQFINQFVERYYYKGKVLLVPHQNYLYCADDFDIENEDKPLKENIFRNIQFGNEALQKKKAKEVFYMKLDDKNVKKLIDSVYSQYGEVIAQALSAYKKTNGEKYKLILEQYAAGDAKFKQLYESMLKEQLDSFIAGNKSAVFPKYKGIDLVRFDNGSPKDTSDIVEMRKEVFEVVAQALKIPLSMMLGNITNMNEIVKVYLSICIDPLADMIGEELTRKYYSFEEWQNGSWVEVDTSCISHVDILEAAQAIYNAIGSGVVNIDDMRNRLGLPPLKTDFSEQFFLTKNYVPAGTMLNADMEGGE